MVIEVLWQIQPYQLVNPFVFLPGWGLNFQDCGKISSSRHVFSYLSSWVSFGSSCFFEKSHLTLLCFRAGKVHHRSDQPCEPDSRYPTNLDYLPPPLWAPVSQQQSRDLAQLAMQSSGLALEGQPAEVHQTWLVVGAGEEPWKLWDMRQW